MDSQVYGPNPSNSQLVLVDSALYSAHGLRTERLRTLTGNIASLATAARQLGIPSTITTRIMPSQGNLSPLVNLRDLRDLTLIQRTELNAWDDMTVQKVLAENGKRYLIVSELWAEDHEFSFALTAMQEANYKAFLVTDASCATSPDQESRTLNRLRKAGVVLTTYRQVLRAWIRTMGQPDQDDFRKNLSRGSTMVPGGKLIGSASK